MKAYEIPDAIQWHEGLLLTPQHFQQLASRHEALVRYGTSMVAPFSWGVRRFKHHQISLTDGKLRILELEAVMPDGLVVVHGLPDATRDELLEIDLSKQAEEIGERGILVYVAVAAHQNGSDSRRFRSFKGDPVADETSATKARPINRLRPRLTLHAGAQLPIDLIGFPLVRMIYRDSSFTIDDKFVPPLLAVPVKSTDGDPASVAAQRLGEMCSDVAMRVRKRAMYLADEARTPSANSRFGNEDAIRTLMLSLVGGLPRMEAVLQTGCEHPYPVYEALCGMAGQLAVMGMEMVPPAFAPYNHNDLYTTFKPVVEFIERTMDQGVPVTYKSFPFTYTHGTYELQFDVTWMKKKLALGIKGERGMTDAEIVKWGENCLIGSQGRMELLQANRITGAGRKHTSRVGDVVTPKGVALFSLKTDENFVEPEKVLQIVNREGPRPCEIVLYVMDN
ncbi:MAG TPA: type VI secretion system baseplate subunit TssK [Pyrinomonadaceae bacterium]|nr:type VI secretion system baseplate subunit TssK [Pyrinomonadaceae bacterium]